MGKIMKSYHAYTSREWRLAMMVIVPAILLAAELAAELAVGDKYPVLYIVMMVWVPTDIFADYWVFGGSCRGRMKYIEYIRTSAKGMMLVRNALRMDIIRRIATVAAFYILAGVIDMARLSPSYRIARLGMGSVVVLLNLCIVLIALNIVRHFVMWNHYCSASMISLMLSGWTFTVATLVEVISGRKAPADWIVRYVGTSVVLAVIVAGLALFTIWQVMHYVQAGYRDEY